MTQEDKELLLRDLCARLPYNVICQVEFKENGKYNSKVMLLSGIFTDEAYFTTKGGSIYSNEYKPYLFPLSNMTDEQCHKFYCRFVENEIDYNDFKKYYFDGCLWNKILTSINDCGDIIDWFNKNHFDYRGLIDKGLAIDATGLNIYIKDRQNKIMKDVEGKKVKVFYDDRKCCEEDDRDPNFLPEQYHVKKEPSRPFHNAEECLNEMMKHQPFGWVYDKNNNQFLNTNRVGNDGVDFYGRQRNTFAKANSYITFADKEPFGIKE